MAYEYPVMQVEDVLAGENLQRNFDSLVTDQEGFVTSFVRLIGNNDPEHEYDMETVIENSERTFERLLVSITEQPNGFEKYELEETALQITEVCKTVRETRQQLLENAFPDASIFFADEFDGAYEEKPRDLEDEEKVANIIMHINEKNAVAVASIIVKLYRPSIVADARVVLNAIDSEVLIGDTPLPDMGKARYDLSAYSTLKNAINLDHIPREVLAIAGIFVAMSVGYKGSKIMLSKLRRHSATEI